MRKILCTLTGFILMGITAHQAHGSVIWHAGSLQDFRTLYSQSTKNVFLYFESEDCGGCNLMEKETFSDPDVDATLMKLGRVKIKSNTPAGIHEAKRYRIYRFPAFLMVTPQDQEITRRIGFLPPREFIQWVHEGILRRNVLTDYLTRLERNPDDPGLNLAIARIYRDRLDLEEATRFYGKVRVLDPENAHGVNAIAIFELAELFMRENRLKDAVILLKIFLNKYPFDRLTEMVYLDLINTYLALHERDQVMEILQSYRKSFDKSDRAHYRFAQFCLDHDMLRDEALESAIKSVSMNAESVDGLTVLAELYAIKGNCSMARETIKKALVLNPGSAQLKKLEQKYLGKKCS